MAAVTRRRAVVRPRRTVTHARDAGFTLTEVLVSLTLIGVVMATLTTFYANSMSLMGYQRGKQTAIRLAADGIEQARAVKAAQLLDGRGPCDSAAAPCPPPAPGVDLSDMVEWDHPTGSAPALRFSDSPQTPYHRSWYVGKCWQPTGGGPCTRTTDAVELLRVVVAVTWRDKSCRSSACTYATSTLVSAAGDPLFDRGAKAAPPKVDPTPRTGEVSVATNVRITGSGAPPLTFFANGLPDGLEMDSSGLVTGTPQQAGVYPVTVSVTDGFGGTASASVTWTIAPLPQLVNPGVQATGKGVPVTFQPLLTGGVGPFEWSVRAPGPWGATGLPPGLSLDTNTGMISGKPTTVGAPKDVTVTVTDANGRSAEVTFGWTVGPAITLPAGLPNQVGACASPPVTVTATAAGTAPYTWTYANLPDGLTMDSGGVITGCVSHGGRYLPTVTVTDATGAASSLTFEWLVNVSSGPRITGPADRTDAVDQPLADPVPIVVSGGKSPYTTTAAGRPPGVALSGTAFTGAPTTPGVYPVTVTVTDRKNRTAKYMFVWTIR